MWGSGRKGGGSGDYRIAFLKKCRADRSKLHTIGNNLQNPVSAGSKAETRDHQGPNFPQSTLPDLAGSVHLITGARRTKIGITRKGACDRIGRRTQGRIAIRIDMFEGQRIVWARTIITTRPIRPRAMSNGGAMSS